MFTFVEKGGVASDIHCHHDEPECVRLALEDLANDVNRISGRRPVVKAFLPEAGEGCVVAGTVSNLAFRECLQLLGVEVPQLEGQWEAYRIQTFGENHQNLLLCGSDPRGTMWAVYEFAEKHLGIDPVGFWTDHEPEPRQELRFKPLSVDGAPPTFRYRGWFLNDEDLLTEWKNGGGRRHIAYRFYGQVVHQDVMEKVLETALRLRQNLMIPASFLDITNPPEGNLVRMAARRGMFVTQHHIESLGVSHFSLEKYWKQRGIDQPPSFVTDKEKVLETWRYYVSQWAEFGSQVIWQLGLRGRGDRPVWDIDPAVPASDQARGGLISEAMEMQRRIVVEATGNDHAVFTTTLWAEGTALHEAGHLRFPPGTIVIFADNLRVDRPGGGRLFAHQWAQDFHSVPRHKELRYGIYYHVAVWGAGPHLVQGVPPAKIESCLRAAVDKGDTAYVITNVTNIREVILGVRTVAALTEAAETFDRETFLAEWCRAQFGPVAMEVRKLYEALSEAYVSEPTDEAPHPALVHDGVLVALGHSSLLFLFQMLEQTLPEPLFLRGTGHLHRESVRQDPEEMVATVLARRPGLQASLERWLGVVHLARLIEPRVSPDRKSFFHHHFIVQSHIAAGLTQWLLAMDRAAELSVREEPDRELRTILLQGVSVLENVLRIRQDSERGRWRNWYRGDRKMDLPTLLDGTWQAVNLLPQETIPSETLKPTQTIN